MGDARHKVGLVLHSSFINYSFLLCSVADELAVEATPVRLQLHEVTSLEKTDPFWLAKYQ